MRGVRIYRATVCQQDNNVGMGGGPTEMPQSEVYVVTGIQGYIRVQCVCRHPNTTPLH